MATFSFRYISRRDAFGFQGSIPPYDIAYDYSMLFFFFFSLSIYFLFTILSSSTFSYTAVIKIFAFWIDSDLLERSYFLPAAGFDLDTTFSSRQA